MSAPAGANQVWVWRPAQSDSKTGFRHPSDVPLEDEAASNACFADQVRGPLLARISPATLLQTKERVVLIAEQGATREIPKPFVLPWYEGLLLLEELEDLQAKGEQTNAGWCNDELRALLQQEKSKFKNGQLSSALYLEKRLLTTAVTGPHFLDSEDKEWAYRRERLRNEDSRCQAEGEDDGQYYRIQDVIGYLPPWEAFCHEKCGFYQDFYQVRWKHPFSEVDYSRVENGSPATGATWEPDECLPAHMDPLRLAAKRSWIRGQREREQRQADARARGLTPSRPEARAAAPARRPQPEERPPAKRARLRRDGTPLDRDIFRASHGHDFAPEEAAGLTFAGVRQGWPKRPQDYPRGYGVADPPGFCHEGCDCMDDQRVQGHWEIHKAWLEDPVRAAAADSALQALAAQERFVRRRGLYTNQCYLETLAAAPALEPHAKAAMELAAGTEAALARALRSVPAHELAAEAPPVRVPAGAFLRGDMDYEPLRFAPAVPSNGPGAWPSWLLLGPDDGQLVAPQAPPAAGPEPQELLVEFLFSEGAAGSAFCSVTRERLEGAGTPWAEVTAAVAQRFSDTGRCPLGAGVREVLARHLAEVYNFSRGRALYRPYGEWLEVMSRLLRMLRSAAVANVARGPLHGVAL